MTAPVWLQDEPEIRALLDAALDRFDALSGEARSRNTWLPAVRFLPALERNDERADQIWALIMQLQRSGILSARLARRSPYDAEWVGAKLGFPAASEETLREWLQRTPPIAVQKQWREAVQQHASGFNGNIDLLLQKRIVVAGRTAEEVVAALAGLAAIEQPATLRQLSSHAFWGDSKVLDDRGELIATLFPQLQVLDRPVVVAVHLPLAPAGVLFIENQDTYTAAVAGEPEALLPYALVYMAGFRTAALRIRARSGACLHFGGAGVAAHAADFESWWFSASMEARAAMFWGDLDFAGMQILKSLRNRFGEVCAWQPGYARMLAALKQQGARIAIEEAGGQLDPQSTGCDYADEVLLPAIRTHGFRDQESIAVR